MPGTFDFAPNSHVALELAPDEPAAVSFNGWEFTARPSVPYRPKFVLTLSGMRWYQNTNGTLNTSTNPTLNAGRLLNFYKTNRKFGTFDYAHEYYGTITCRFAEPLQLPRAIPNSAGLLPDFDVTLIQMNPAW